MNGAAPYICGQRHVEVTGATHCVHHEIEVQSALVVVAHECGEGSRCPDLSCALLEERLADRDLVSV